MGKKVFVSYCHQQGDWVWDRLVPVLEAGGAILPFGGLSLGHRGFAMGLWAEALTALAGGECNDATSKGRQSCHLILIDPGAFAGLEATRRQLRRLEEWVLSSPENPAQDGIRLPGSRFQDRLTEAMQEGLLVDAEMLSLLPFLKRDDYNQPSKRFQRATLRGAAVPVPCCRRWLSGEA